MEYKPGTLLETDLESFEIYCKPDTSKPTIAAGYDTKGNFRFYYTTEKGNHVYDKASINGAFYRSLRPFTPKTKVVSKFNRTKFNKLLESL